MNITLIGSGSFFYTASHAVKSTATLETHTVYAFQSERNVQLRQLKVLSHHYIFEFPLEFLFH